MRRPPVKGRACFADKSLTLEGLRLAFALPAFLAFVFIVLSSLEIYRAFT